MQRRSLPMDRRIMREINQSTVLNLVRAHAPISRPQLTKLSGLSQGTITSIISIFMKNEWIIETGVAESTGGRKAGLLELNPHGGYTIGIHLEEHVITGAIMNLHGDIVYGDSWKAALRNNGNEAVAIIAEGLEEFLCASGVPRKKVIGLGCGVSGVINAREGVSIDSWILNWHNICLGPPLTKRLQMPVFVENAVDCLISYEKLFGRCTGYHDFLLVSLGRGLGLSMIVRDEVYRGGLGEGSEFGHIPFLLPGRTCECGKQGCLEEYIADRGILQTYRELAGEVEPHMPAITNIEALFRRVQEGDEKALEAFRQTGEYLGIGLATLVNLFNPECIILYGGEGHRLDCMQEPMQMKLKEHIFSELGGRLTLLLEHNTTMENWARGAGCIVLRRFFAASSAL